MLRQFNKYELLIFDDFGMEHSTEFALEQVFNLIDSRYRCRKPLIVTTNLSLDDIKNPYDIAHQHIYDRILQLCTPVLIDAPNVRKIKAEQQMEILRNSFTASAEVKEKSKS